MKHFSGAATDYMKDYIELSLRNPPDQFIRYVVTNDLASNQMSEEI